MKSVIFQLAMICLIAMSSSVVAVAKEENDDFGVRKLKATKATIFTGSKAPKVPKTPKKTKASKAPKRN